MLDLIKAIYEQRAKMISFGKRDFEDIRSASRDAYAA